VVLLAGIVLVIVASGTASKVGFVLAFLAVAFVVAGQLPTGMTGGGWMVGQQRPRDTVADPEPEYIDRAATPSEDDWRREQERYRDRERSDRSEHLGK
jgi:hypothetical protein